jgi:hypothetical protein
MGYLVTTIAIGFIDEFYGVWQQENEYNSNLNPVMRRIQENQKVIINLLKELQSDRE